LHKKFTKLFDDRFHIVTVWLFGVVEVTSRCHC